MNNFELLKQTIGRTLPQASIETSLPLRENGVWSMDVELLGNKLSIEWSEANGFGLSTTSNENFAEGPDEVLPSVEQAQIRVFDLLANGSHTSPPIGRLLSRLREKMGLTQGQLAGRLGVRQATISGFERRRDVQISTLERLIKALGGRLQILGVFPDATYRIDGHLDNCNILEPKLETTDTRSALKGDLADSEFECLKASGAIQEALQASSYISSAGTTWGFQ